MNPASIPTAVPHLHGGVTGSRIAALRSVALDVPDLVAAEAFYTRVWGLVVAARSSDAIYLRGSGSDHHLLALHRKSSEADTATIRHVDLRARSLAALEQIGADVARCGGLVLSPMGPIAEPGGGVGLTLGDECGRVFRIVHGDAMRSPLRSALHGAPQEDTGGPKRFADRPIRLAHVVLNSRDVAGTQTFFEQVLGFRLTDRTRIMAFMNCNADHHSIALGDADNNALNHIAFLMPDVDAVMRGAGRMRDAGYATEWGPGRHGPGNNAFNYFVGPFDVVIEYTAEVEQVDERYRVGKPEDWTWPPGRIDQWGISPPPTARLKQAQKAVLFSTAGVSA